MSNIAVSTCPSELDVEQWERLTRRAFVNVFLHPAALNAVRATGFADLQVLLAWDESVAPRQLAGVWALQRESFASFIPPLLAAPAYNYAFLSGPIVDPALKNEVIEAFFEAIVIEPKLPNVLRLNCLDAESDSYFAILKALETNAWRALTLAERDRPFAFKDATKPSGSTRKKLRQSWNRLSALGTVEIVNERDPLCVKEAFETFLAMEAASWKGAQRTALLSKAKDAAFARRLIGDLAHAHSASVAVMTVDGRAIACQVLLYCGAMAYTWKTAFDSDFAKYSPGMVLLDRVTERLLSSGLVEAIESCSPEGGFMAQLWVGRRSTVDLLVQLDDKHSLTFILAALVDSAWTYAKRLRNAVRPRTQPPRMKPSTPASG